MLFAIVDRKIGSVSGQFDVDDAEIIVEIDMEYPEATRCMHQTDVNLIITLFCFWLFVAEEDNTSSNYGVDLADEDTRFEESLLYNGQTHRSLALS